MTLKTMFSTLTAAAALLAGAATASAHVEVTAGSAPGEVVLSVPNESSSADTVGVAVQLPENVVRVQVPATAGWTHTETTVPLDPPVVVDGAEVAQRVSTVTWSGGRFGPGVEKTFRLRLAVAEGTKRSGLAFPAVQRYSDGEVVRWIGAENSEFPAGVLDSPLPAVAAVPVTTTQTATTQTTATATTSTSASSDPADQNPVGLAFAIAGAAIATAGVIFVIRWRNKRDKRRT